MGEPTDATIRAALAAYAGLEGAQLRPLSGGLINLTYAVEAGARRLILQRVSPIFSPEIHANIVAVSERLRARGERSPSLLRSVEGRPWVDLGDAGIWRLMTRLEGTSYDSLEGPQGPARARSAGRLIARFHGALLGLEHTFVGLRSGVHDTPAHLAKLRLALEEGATTEHRLHAPVAELGGHILAAAESQPPLHGGRSWVVHGDLKISNILFEGDEARALIDLDTVSPMPLWMELGDAWRSWCNPSGEDQSKARFDLEIFAASIQGYLGALEAPLLAEERRSLVFAVERIALELSARFAADAIQENYFGWDRSRFPAAGEHNLLRARGQWSLFEAAIATRKARAELLQVRSV